MNEGLARHLEAEAAALFLAKYRARSKAVAKSIIGKTEPEIEAILARAIEATLAEVETAMRRKYGVVVH